MNGTMLSDALVVAHRVRLPVLIRIVSQFGGVTHDMAVKTLVVPTSYLPRSF